MDLVPNCDELVKLSVKNEVMTKAGNSTHWHQFSQTELDVKVENEDTIMEKLNFEIKSEPLDTKFGILNHDNDLIYVKIEPIITTEEIHIKADQDQIATEQTIHVSTCEEQGIAETCIPQAITDSITYKNPPGSDNNTSDDCCNASQTEGSGIHCHKCSPKTSISNIHHACAQMAQLERHLKTHTRERPFKCSVCDYSCAQKSHLERHLKTHTGEKPFKCSVCDYRCVQKAHLERHLKIHTRERPFKCSVCDYRCAQKTQLEWHLKTHTGEKPFKCSVCDYRCAQKAHLHRHWKTHTGEKPFKCSICDYRCALKTNLERHLKTHTGEKP